MTNSTDYIQRKAVYILIKNKEQKIPSYLGPH